MNDAKTRMEPADRWLYLFMAALMGFFLGFAAGFKRSTTAIHLKIKRLGIIAADGEGFTMCGLCNILWAGQGMHHIIQRWMERG